MDLLKCHGRRFRAKIYGTECEGKVCVENNNVFLCQDEKHGKTPHNTFGYKYGWGVGDGGDKTLKREEVTCFRLLEMTKEEVESYYDWKVGDIVKGDNLLTCVVGGRINNIVFLIRIDSECVFGPFTCKQIYNMGYRLVVDEPQDDTVELTIDDIAKKFEVDPSKIKIKKE